MKLSEAVTAATIEACATRDQAADLLKSATRAQLVVIATELHMGALSAYNKSALIEAIIEQAVGYRLNSQAIRGL